MGTRNLTCVIYKGEFKVAQYGQWDGYPSGQGLACLGFLREEMDETFSQKVNLCKSITEETLEQYWIDAGNTKQDGFVSCDVSDKFQEMYPHLHRNCGAEILHLVQDSLNGLELKMEQKFASSGMCEYAYVVDLDKRVLEVYSSSAYYEYENGSSFEGVVENPAIRKIETFNFDFLPGDDEFVSAIEKKRI